MSDTPETDAAVEASGGDWSPVLRAVAQRLERERDEWEAMSGRYKQERDIAEADATNFNARIFELINERDEAREQIARLRAIISQSNRDYDEQIELFRAANAKLRDIAERAQTICERWVSPQYADAGAVKQLRAELDQLKEGGK